MTGRALNAGWQLVSSQRLHDATGSTLSQPGVDTEEWLGIDLPATVLGALVDAGEYGDPFVDARLKEIPGQGPPATNFSNHPMPADSPFAQPWWYRKAFTVDAPKHVRLALDGINYRANVWLNGKLIADSRQLVGAYREHVIDITAELTAGDNVLAIEVSAPDECDLAITWVDWNPSPPDKNMGLWRDVRLLESGPVALEAPHVLTRLTDDLKRADLTVAGDLVNLSDQRREATVRAHFEGQALTKTFTLEPGDKQRFEIDSTDHPELSVDSPRLWWPRPMGAPALYPIAIEVWVDDERSDASDFDFGIREVDSVLTEDGHAQFRVNRQPVLIRGAGWASDLFLRRQPQRDWDTLAYVEAMNLNTIRFEGVLERAELLERCDRNGTLVIAGWCCCDCWEKWDKWNDENHVVAPESLRSQVRRVRRHPCMLAWWYGSDFPPPAHVEQSYLDVLEQEHWPNAVQSSAANKPTDLTGPSGLKMEGPYDWVPPNYWLEDTERGGAFGFATEVCPGPAVPPIESLTKMLSEEHRWPIDEVWNFHAGGQEFHNIEAFTKAIIGRYGPIDDAEQMAQLSQLATYEAQRAMFEAFAKNRPRATGVVQWMLNNAWPSLIWHLFDYYLRPGGGYFGTQRACEPLHVQYSYDDRTVVVVNQFPRAWRDLEVHARVLTPKGELLHEARTRIDVDADANKVAFVLPECVDPRFVDLRLREAERECSRNLYWLESPDELDHAKGSWIHTPVRSYADLSAVRTLEPAELEVRCFQTGQTRIHVELDNGGDALCFFTQLRLCDDAGNDVLPVLWDDNYLSLWPGESCVVTATVPAAADLHVEVRPFNGEAVRVTPQASSDRNDHKKEQKGQPGDAGTRYSMLNGGRLA